MLSRQAQMAAWHAAGGFGPMGCGGRLAGWGRPNGARPFATPAR